MEPVRVSALLSPRTPVSSPVLRPADIGGPVAWQVTIRDGGLRVVAHDAALPINSRTTPDIRAAAIAPSVPSTYVVTRASAVWLHCGGTVPARLDLARRSGTRRLASDSMLVGTVRVTTPCRTAVDVAAQLAPEAAIDLLLRLARAGTDLCAAERLLEMRNRVVGRPAARTVLAAAREQLAATSHTT